MTKHICFFALLIIAAGACKKETEKKPEAKAAPNQISFTDEQLKYIKIDTCGLTDMPLAQTTGALVCAISRHCSGPPA